MRRLAATALAIGVTAAVAVPALAGSQQATPTIVATEREYSIALGARTVKRGKLVIRVHNAGGIAHALSVSGPGLPEASTPNIGAGGRTTLTVNLKQPGRYTVWCPIAGHREAGMVTTLVVS